MSNENLETDLNHHKELVDIDEEMKKHLEEHESPVQNKEEIQVLTTEKEEIKTPQEENQMSKETLQAATLKEIMDEMKGITTQVQPQEIIKELKPFSQRFLQFFISLFPIFNWVWNYK